MTPVPSSSGVGFDRSGPGTRDDIKWWTGWTVGATRKALAAIDAVEVDLEGGGTGYLLPDDLEPVEAPEPWVALLPALDAATMGWKERDWYLDGHRAALFDNAGNGGPTIWVDGRIVGGWAQRRDGEIAPHLLEDVGAEDEARDRRGSRPPCRVDRAVSLRSMYPSPARDRAEGLDGRRRRIEEPLAPDLGAAEERAGGAGPERLPDPRATRPPRAQPRLDLARIRSSAGTASRPRCRSGRARAWRTRRRCSRRRIGRSRRRR